MSVDAHIGGPLSRIPWRIIGWGTAVFLLLLPWAANAPWTLSDYVFAGVVFAIVGGILELAAWKSSNLAYRAAVAIAVATGVLHIWWTEAVGIIGNEDNPGNLLYLGAVAIAIFGAILALGRPAGMAWAMGVTAVAEVLVPAIAYAGVADPAGDVLSPGVFICGAFFTGMWLLSGALFRIAVLQERPRQ